MKTLFRAYTGALLLGSFLLAVSCTGGKTSEAVSPRSVTLSETEIQMHVGDTRKLEATVLPENAADKSITWSSLNTQRVTVAQDGTVSAVAVGTAYVVAQAANGVKASCLVKVKASEEVSYGVKIHLGDSEAPGTIYSYPGNTVQLSAVSDDGKAHDYIWGPSEGAITVSGGNVTFGLGGHDELDGFAWYSQAMIHVSSVDGFSDSVNAVSSVGRYFRFGASTEAVGSNVTMLSGKTAEVSLTYYDGSAFVPMPNSSFSLQLEDNPVLSLDGYTLTSSRDNVGSAALKLILCEEEFLLCNVVVVKDGSEESSGEAYTEEPVNW